MSQLARARSVRQRCLDVCVVNSGTPARTEMPSTTLDHVQMVTGRARLRRDSERNSRPRSVLSARHSRRYTPYNLDVASEYGTTLARGSSYSPP
jgi:hypothetical protein